MPWRSARRCGPRRASPFQAQRCGAPAPTSGSTVVYLDASALLKLIVAETESRALRRYLRARRQRATCSLARVEVLRAVRAHGARATTRARALLQRVDTIAMDDELLERAAAI